jgi:hypothetical protein
VIDAMIGLAMVLAIWPLSICALRLAKKHRGGAIALASLMILFGMNTVPTSPPPPPQIDVAAPVEEEAGDDEPK